MCAKEDDEVIKEDDKKLSIHQRKKIKGRQKKEQVKR